MKEKNKHNPYSYQLQNNAWNKQTNCAFNFNLYEYIVYVDSALSKV